MIKYNNSSLLLNTMCRYLLHKLNHHPYMQKSFIAFFFVILCYTAMSQSVGIGTNIPNANAALEIKQTTNKGFLMPRGNAATRTALNNNTAKGLMLYDTVTNSLWIHNGNGLASGWNNQQIITSGSIIPYASADPITVTTLIGGSPGAMALVGFGNSYSGVTSTGGVIDLTSGGNFNYAFSAPRNGTITSVSAYFSTTNSFSSVGATVFMTAQLYSSPAPNNIFSPIPGGQVVISPGLTGIIPIGTVTYGTSTGLSIPVTAQTRLLLVFFASAPGSFSVNTISGFASAGVTIE